jgi:hypothetical protein
MRSHATAVSGGNGSANTSSVAKVPPACAIRTIACAPPGAMPTMSSPNCASRSAATTHSTLAHSASFPIERTLKTSFALSRAQARRTGLRRAEELVAPRRRGPGEPRHAAHDAGHGERRVPDRRVDEEVGARAPADDHVLLRVVVEAAGQRAGELVGELGVQSLRGIAERVVLRDQHGIDPELLRRDSRLEHEEDEAQAERLRIST